MQGLQYIELEENSSSQSSENGFIFKYSDKITEYLNENNLIYNIQLIFQDRKRQLLRINEASGIENNVKTLLYVSYLEDSSQIETIINERSIKIQSSNPKYLQKFIKYDIIQNERYPLVIQHIESSYSRVPLDEILKTSITFDQCLRIIRRMVKIMIYFHRQGIAHLDLSLSNFEVNVQSYHPSMIAVPLQIRNDVQQNEACFKDFEEIGLMMIKVLNNCSTHYSGDHSFQQMKLKACLEQICSNFKNCSHSSNGIQEFVDKQINWLTRINQFNQRVSQETDSSIQQFGEQKKRQVQLNQEIENLEIEILRSVPSKIETNVQDGKNSSLHKWIGRIFCLVMTFLFFASIFLLWGAKSSPFQCHTISQTEQYCTIDFDHEGILFDEYKPDNSIKSLTIDFKRANLKADKIIYILKKIRLQTLQVFRTYAQGTDIDLEGLRTLLLQNPFKYVTKNILNIQNTPIDKNYKEMYNIDPQKAYRIVEDLLDDYCKIIKDYSNLELEGEIGAYLFAIYYLRVGYQPSQKGIYDLYLVDRQLQDNETFMILKHIFDQKHNGEIMQINLQMNNNLLDGSCVISFLQQYIKSNQKLDKITLQFSKNPITKENYQKLISQLKESIQLRIINLELDLHSNYFDSESEQMTFFEKMEKSQLESLNIRFTDASTQDIYQLTRNLPDLKIPFELVFEVDSVSKLSKFLKEFPSGTQFCNITPSKTIINSDLTFEYLEVRSSLVRSEKYIKSSEICKMESPQVQGISHKSLQITAGEVFLSTSVSIADSENSSQYSITAFVKEQNTGYSKDFFSFEALKILSQFQFYEYNIYGEYMSSEGITNLVETANNNEKLEELNLSLECNSISNIQIGKLLTLFTSHPTLKSASLSLHYKQHFYGEEDYPVLFPIINSEQAVLNILSDALKQTQHLEKLNLSIKSSYSSFQSLLLSFENSPTVSTLSLDFNNNNFTENEIRHFYQTKKRLQEKGKQLLFSSRMIYLNSFNNIISFYEQIIYGFQDKEKRVYIPIQKESPLSQQMINDFISEIPNSKAQEIIINNFDDQFLTMNLVRITNKISENTYIQSYQIEDSTNSLLFTTEEIKSMLDHLTLNQSIDFLKLNLKAHRQSTKNAEISDSLRLLIQNKSNLKQLQIRCEQCFYDEVDLFQIMTAAYSSPNLISGSIIDSTVKLNEFYLKRMAFMKAASNKSELYPFLPTENLKMNEYFTQYLSQFTSYRENELTLVYINSEIEDDLIPFIIMFLERKVTTLQRIKLDFSGNRITDSGIKQLTKEFSKLSNLDSLSLNFQKNQIENKGCLDLINSYRYSVGKIKSISLNLKETNLQLQSSCYYSLIELIQLSGNLEEVYLAMPIVTQDIFTSITSALSSKQHIQQIELDFNDYYLKLSEARSIGTYFGKIETLKKFSIKGQYEKLVSAYFNFEKTKLESNIRHFNLDFSETYQYYETLNQIADELNKTNEKPLTMTLNLSTNRLEDDSIYPIIDYLSSQSCEKIIELELNLSNNPLSQETCSLIQDSLNHITDLQVYTFDMRNTDMGFACIESIAAMKKKSKGINQIVIKANDFTMEEQKKAKDLFEKCECVGFVFN